MNKNLLTKILILILVFCILFFLNLFFSKKEKFYAKEGLEGSFEQIKYSQEKCEEFDISHKKLQDKEQMRIEEITYYRLKELNDQLEILENILKNVITKIGIQNTINDKCASDKQHKINLEFENLLELEKNNMVKDESLNLNLNLSDTLKKIKLKAHKLPKTVSKKKCKHSDKNMVDIIKNKELIESKCHNCKVDKIVDK